MNIRRSVFFYLVTLSLITAIQSVSFAAITDPYLDQITSWKDASPDKADNPKIVLGPPNCKKGFTIGPGDELIAAFTDNYAIDGPGDDIFLYANIDASDPDTADVWASADNVSYVLFENDGNDEGHDLSDYDSLNFVKYLKFIGTSNGGSSQGYHLLGVEALNSFQSQFREL